MTNQAFDEWMKLSKSAVEPMMKLNALTVDAMEQVARQQLDVARDYLDLGTKQAHILGSSQSPEQLVAEQGKLVAEFGERLVSRAQEFVKIASQTQEAVASWAQRASTETGKAQAKKAGA
jgi:phasin family protein